MLIVLGKDCASITKCNHVKLKNLTLFCQFVFAIIQLFSDSPEFFGFNNISELQEDDNVASSSYKFQDIHMQDGGADESEDFSRVLVARNLTMRWLIHDDLDKYYAGADDWWVKPRSTAWFYDFLMVYYEDDRWIENMRMTRHTFNDLCDIVGASIVKQDTNYRKAIPVFARVGAAVYKLTSGDGFGKVSEKFAMGKTSVRRVLGEVCQALGECLGHLIGLPSGQDLIDVMSAFEEQCGLPNVAGAIDGTHITIIAPNTGFYRDYHKNMKYSMCLQAVCDTSWRFRDIFVGMPGSTNDTCALKYSSLWLRACRRLILNEDPETLPWGVPVRPYFLGDLGYPLMSWLLIPIRHLALNARVTREEKLFNSKHRRGRRHVEQTFGLFKKIFREMGQKTDLSVQILPSVVRACCILHNFLIQRQENDYQDVLREWEMEGVGQAGDEIENEQNNNPAPENEGMQGNLVEEEMAGLRSTRTLVAYLNARR